MSLQRLLLNSRFLILLFAVLLSGGLYLWASQAIPDPMLRTIRLEQLYGFSALILLYVALLATPLTKLFARLPGRRSITYIQPALGGAALYFATLHASINFFKQLGGWTGLGFLSTQYLVALACGLTGLVVLGLLAATSVDRLVRSWPERRRALVRQAIYLAGVVVLIHIVMVGTHFSTLSAAIPRALGIAMLILLILEVIRLDIYLRSRLPRRQIYVPAIAIITIGVGYGYILSYTGNTGSSLAGLNIHAQHVQLAQDALKDSGNSGSGTASNTSNIPGLSGDRSKRFTVSFEHATVQPGQETQLGFKIYDATNGSSDFNLQPINTKLAHLVIVDESLQYFSHIHPLPASSITDLVVTTSLPHAGRYRLYLNYQPSGAIEQQVGFSLTVGAPSSAKTSIDPTVAADRLTAKNVDGYNIKLQPDSYSASKFTLGEQKISFTVSNASGSPVTTLKPYLGAFGHLVLINEETYDYMHVHPYSTTIPAQDASSGPGVDFLPIGIYGPIKPGTYRAFAEFNPDNKLIMAPFTVKVGQ